MSHILSMAFTENTCSFEKIEGFQVFFKWKIWRPINWLPEHLRNFISLYTKYLSVSKWNSSFFFLFFFFTFYSFRSLPSHEFCLDPPFLPKKIETRILGGATIYDMGGGSQKSWPVQHNVLRYYFRIYTDAKCVSTTFPSAIYIKKEIKKLHLIKVKINWETDGYNHELRD